MTGIALRIAGPALAVEPDALEDDSITPNAAQSLSYDYTLDLFFSLFAFDGADVDWVEHSAPVERVPAIRFETAPPLDATLMVIHLDPQRDTNEGSVAFQRDLLAARRSLLLKESERVLLVAPAEADGLVFSHWEISGVRQAERQRMTPLTAGGETHVVAVFAPPAPGGPSVSTISIASTPDPGVPIDIVNNGDVVARVVTDGDLEMLNGEAIRAVAPTRHQKLAFSRWNIQGRPQDGGEVALNHNVAGDASLIAEYVRVGDMNGDDQLDRADVELFILSLAQPSEYERRYPGLDRLRRADVNGDGVVTQADIDAFVELLLGE